MSGQNNEQMLEMYIFETEQNIEQLETLVLSSEKELGFAEDALHELFRLMHTIKGSSGMMSYQSLASVAHHLEDLFYYLREQQPQNVDYTILSDLVLEGIDLMKVELQKIKNGEEADSDTAPLIKSIEDYLQLLKQQNGAESETAVALAQPDSAGGFCARADAVTYKAVVHFAADCAMENVRAYALVHSLQAEANVLQLFPADLDDDDSAEIIRTKGLTVYLQSELEAEQIEEIFWQTPFLNKLELTVVDSLQSEEAAWDAAQLPKQQQNNHTAASNSVISVSVNKLDKLMDLVGEMVIAESMVIQNPDLNGLELENFEKAARQLHKITSELQDLVMSIRMVPLATTFHKMHRLVRDMSRQLQKDVQLQLIGEHTEVDKNIIEHIADPIMHLIRNAIDHGLETAEEREALGKPAAGTITLEAKNTGSDVLILIKDDGRGLNKDKILERAREHGLLTKMTAEMTEKEIFELIFLPGFSTKDNVTEFSGRGVGMDVVAKNLEMVGGAVSVSSVAGQGTVFTLKIPLTLAIMDSMNVKVGASCYTIPIISIKECLRLQQHTLLNDTEGYEMLMVRGECYPIFRLHQYFNVKNAVTDLEKGVLVMVEHDKKSFLLFVDELLGQQEVVVKALPAYIKERYQSKGISGCTLLGDGSISLILDVGGFVQ
ncbi:MAG: chemotaxis protein CheA [Firmicutes bacterium]|nr:chemotaxis protein CheA [Bacillota bacterium]